MCTFYIVLNVGAWVLMVVGFAYGKMVILIGSREFYVFCFVIIVTVL